MTAPPTIQGSAPRPQGTSLAAAYSVFSVVFLITMIVSTAVTYILPEAFSSTARIQVDSLFDRPDSIQAEFEIIQSQLVLKPVVANLNLNEMWGKKYFNGEMLKTTESLKILKMRLSLAPVRGTKLIAITVESDDRHEAAILANAVAKAYQEYSLERQKLAEAGNTNAPQASISPVQIIDQAEPSAHPSRPNKPLNLTLGAVVGAVLGLFAASLLYVFRREQ